MNATTTTILGEGDPMMNHIREIRERQGLPQYRLAQALDRSAGWLWKIETQQLSPGPEDRAKIADLLGVPETDVFPETP